MRVRVRQSTEALAAQAAAILILLNRLEPLAVPLPVPLVVPQEPRHLEVICLALLAALALARALAEAALDVRT